MGTLSIGVDTGGTFTDLVLVDRESGHYIWYKLPTTSAEPSRGILDGIAGILSEAGGSAASVEFLSHGTTLATNAILEGRTARTGMITSRGFRDVIEIGRQRRPHFFNLDIPKPTPPAPRDCRLEVAERLTEDGSVITPLDEDALRECVAALRERNVQAVAICFLHAYANPAHEERAAALLRSLWPGIYICRSSEILNEFREYERFATAVVNASLMPVIDRYLERFVAGTHELGIAPVPRVMQSNGGAVSPDAVRRAPVNTFFSGPAGGVIAAAGIGRRAGLEDLIAFDMGGTSTDVCLIRNGEPAFKNERDIVGFPVRTRSIDIHTIGAGGGSIAWIDPGGLLKVGPRSAGAEPGPAAYGRGGDEPTVTDANIALGRLGADRFLGGRMSIDADRAIAAIDGLARHMQVDPLRAAHGILEIVNANMMGAIRVVSIEKGEDPRDFTLVAFGGAGPMHAADVARGMGIRRVLVPPRPGLLSALGLLHADLRGDFSVTRLLRASPTNRPALQQGLDGLQRRATEWLDGEGTSSAHAVFDWFVEMRYHGQAYEIVVPIPDGRLDQKNLDALVRRFHARHEALNGYVLADQPVETVNLRLVVTVARSALPADAAGCGDADAATPRDASTRVWFPEAGFIEVPVFQREALPVENEMAGPAIVEQMDSTTVIPPDARLRVDEFGNLHIDVTPIGGSGAQSGAGAA